MARLSERLRGEFTFVTQNVDDLLERAAQQEDVQLDKVLHLHGSLERVRCHDCARPAELEPTPNYRELPTCMHCGGKLRPDVVWFGEQLPTKVLEHAKRAAQRAEVCLIIGASALVHPAAELPMIAKYSGARLIEINTRESMLTEACDVHIEGTAIDVLVRLEALLERNEDYPSS